jgi:hypothetical protein
MNPKITLKITKGNSGYVLGYLVKSNGKILFTKRESSQFVSRQAAHYYGQCIIKDANQLGYFPV